MGTWHLNGPFKDIGRVHRVVVFYKADGDGTHNAEYKGDDASARAMMTPASDSRAIAQVFCREDVEGAGVRIK